MKRLIGFDLDDTLVVTKSPIVAEMASLLQRLTQQYDVAIITGGAYKTIQANVLNHLNLASMEPSRLHVMPTCGTQYYRYSDTDWKPVYQEMLPLAERELIIGKLTKIVKDLGMWNESAVGALIDDRESQVTFSALGQQATAEDKYAWDPTNTKRQLLLQQISIALPDYEAKIDGTTSIDIVKPGLDKAYGMRKLLESLKLDIIDALFVGDKLDVDGNDYPIKAMGVETIAVTKWQDTAAIIEQLLAQS